MPSSSPGAWHLGTPYSACVSCLAEALTRPRALGSNDIVVQQRAFITHFFRDSEDVRHRANQFLRLYTVFKEMLISGTLRGAKNWLPKARMCVHSPPTQRIAHDAVRALAGGALFC